MPRLPVASEGLRNPACRAESVPACVSQRHRQRPKSLQKKALGDCADRLRRVAARLRGWRNADRSCGLACRFCQNGTRRKSPTRCHIGRGVSRGTAVLTQQRRRAAVPSPRIARARFSPRMRDLRRRAHCPIRTPGQNRLGSNAGRANVRVSIREQTWPVLCPLPSYSDSYSKSVWRGDLRSRSRLGRRSYTHAQPLRDDSKAWRVRGRGRVGVGVGVRSLDSTFDAKAQGRADHRGHRGAQRENGWPSGSSPVPYDHGLLISGWCWW